MKESDFEAKNTQDWRQYDMVMENLERGNHDAVDTPKVPGMVRKLCSDLSLARHRMYGSRTCENLNYRVTRGHKLVAKADGGFRDKVVKFFMADFPQAMRKEWKLLVVCWLVFLVPFFVMWMSYSYDQEWADSMLGDGAKGDLDASYGKGDDSNLSMRDEFGANFMMFGHYIHNNIGIDLLIFAGGALAGIGSLFFLAVNGLSMGASLAYVLNEGSPEKLLSFVSGHVSYELLGMVVAGMAGMRIGLAMIKPGQMSRAKALLESGKSGLPLIIGACCLTFLAAIIEGFWSAQNVSPDIKYKVGYAGWFLLALYFIFVGRGKKYAA